MSKETLGKETSPGMTDEALREVGINSDTWEHAQQLGWKFATNLGGGEFSYASILTARGYEVMFGQPMGANGPVESETEDGFPLSTGLYVLGEPSTAREET